MADVIGFFDELELKDAKMLRRASKLRWTFYDVIEGDLGYVTDFRFSYSLHLRIRGKTFLRALEGYKPFLIEFAALTPKMLALLPERQRREFCKTRLFQRACDPPQRWPRVELELLFKDVDQVNRVLENAADADHREGLLTAFQRRISPRPNISDICWAARVDYADFKRWRRAELPDSSAMSASITRVLNSEKHPLEQRPRPER